MDCIPVHCLMSSVQRLRGFPQRLFPPWCRVEHVCTDCQLALNVGIDSVTLMTHVMFRVRTILVLGYWVLGNIHRYWIVLLLGHIFCCSDTQYSTNQTAVSTVHMPVNNYLVLLVTCTLTAAIVCLDTVLICCWSLLWYTLVSILVFVIGIARGQSYWVLDIGCLSWYRSNPSHVTAPCDQFHVGATCKWFWHWHCWCRWTRTLLSTWCMKTQSLSVPSV